MDKIASLTPEERLELFRQTAAEMDIHSAIVEKDFWVCWTLKHIFDHPELGKEMIFKGGTTLSKVYGVIERFSEDIDVSISRKLLGFVGKLDPAHPGLGANKRKKLLEEMNEKCSEHVRTTLKHKLEQEFALIISRSSSIWELIYQPDTDGISLLLISECLIDLFFHFLSQQ